jgi:hypothetical protein
MCAVVSRPDDAADDVKIHYRLRLELPPYRLGASHCKMPLLGFLASTTMSTTLATSIGRLMEGDAPVSPAARPTWGTCGGTDCC